MTARAEQLRPGDTSIGLHHLEHRIRRELAIYGYDSWQSWVPPGSGSDASVPVYDVVIIGGGQSGLSTAFGLLRLKVTRIAIFDRRPAGREGPWNVFARMQTLRTPKEIPGPELGFASASFQSWYEAQHGALAYDTLGNIPKDDWAEYLSWFRRVLHLPVVNDATVLDVRPASHVLELDVDHCGRVSHVHARKVVFATGIDGVGTWSVPRLFSEALPPQLYAHTSDAIDFTALQGKHVGVVGGGASAFDNARESLEAGASSVRLFCRSEIPVKDPFHFLWRGRDDGMRSLSFPGTNMAQGLEGARPADLLAVVLDYVRDLDDPLRWQILWRLFEHGRSPATTSYIARTRWPANFHLHPGTPVSSVERRGEGLAITTTRAERFDLDFVILGTGVVNDLRSRIELQSLVGDVALWSDRFQPPPGFENEELGQFPYLSRSFQLMPRVAGTAPHLANVFSFTDMLHLSVGIQSIQYCASRIVDAIARQLFVESASAHVRYLEEGMISP